MPAPESPWRIAPLGDDRDRGHMGKTALAMNIAEHIAVNENRPVAVFSLEMSAQQLVQRLLSRAGVNSQKVRDGTFLVDAISRS